MVKPARKPEVTDEEQEYRIELYPDVKTVKNKNILCTSCNGSLKELISKGKPKTHPFLSTLLCEKCNSFFGDGEFSVDEDGSDKYCRWCGQGGTLYLCSTCSAGFCKKCIKRNLPRAALKEVEDDDWQCFCCNVKPLYELRAHCWAANKFASEFVKNDEGKKRRNKKSEENEESDSDKASNDSEEETKEEEETTRKSKRGRKQLDDGKLSLKSGRSTKSDEKSKVYKPIVSKLSATIKDALNMTDLFKRKASICLSKKITLNNMKNIDNVEEVFEKVDSLLESVESITKQLRTSVKDFMNDWRKEMTEPESKNNDEDKVKAEDKTINGIEDGKKSVEEDDRLGNESKEKDDSLEEKFLEKSMEVDNNISSDIINDSISAVSKTNDSDSGELDDKEVDDKKSKEEDDGVKDDDQFKTPIKEFEVSEKGDFEENNDQRETPAKRKTLHDSDEVEDIPSKENLLDSSKKIKTDDGEKETN